MGQSSSSNLNLKRPATYQEWAENLNSLTFNTLVQESEKFEQVHQFATNDNRIQTIASVNPKLQEKILSHFKETRILIHHKVLPLLDGFLEFKRQYGSQIERDLYKNLTTDDFINRLIDKRPIHFFSARDSTRLRNNMEVNSGATIHWLRVGSEKETKIKLVDYLSYDEMQISALIGVSSPTFFINNGSRDNQGILSGDNNYEKEGIYIGLVGTRFEHLDQMESQHVLIFKKANTPEKGYGAQSDPDNPLSKRLEIWAKLYQQQQNSRYMFLSWSEAEEEYQKTQDQDNPRVERYKTQDGEQLYFNIEVFKRRLEITVELFLFEANERAEKAGKQAYVHAVGLGMGAWQVTNDQEEWFLEVFAEVIQSNPLDHIDDINFSWWRGTTCGGKSSGESLQTSSGHKIKVIFSKRDPAQKLVGPDTNKLLVCSYAWDSNAFPGNEYWCGLLDASGDPAAACCSTIPEVQNAYINPALCVYNTYVAHPDGMMKRKFDENTIQNSDRGLSPSVKHKKKKKSKEKDNN